MGFVRGFFRRKRYRCYQKSSSSRTCDGQSTYKATALNEAVENQVRLFLSKLEAVPKERLVELASARNEETYKVAYKQAQKDFENTQKKVAALEEEAVKALTEESQLGLEPRQPDAPEAPGQTGSLPESNGRSADPDAGGEGERQSHQGAGG